MCKYLLACCSRVGYSSTIVQVERLSKGNLQKCFSDIVCNVSCLADDSVGGALRSEVIKPMALALCTEKISLFVIFFGNIQTALDATLSSKAWRCTCEHLLPCRRRLNGDWRWPFISSQSSTLHACCASWSHCSLFSFFNFSPTFSTWLLWPAILSLFLDLTVVILPFLLRLILYRLLSLWLWPSLSLSHHLTPIQITSSI